MKKLLLCCLAMNATIMVYAMEQMDCETVKSDKQEIKEEEII